MIASNTNTTTAQWLKEEGFDVDSDPIWEDMYDQFSVLQTLLELLHQLPTSWGVIDPMELREALLWLRKQSLIDGAFESNRPPWLNQFLESDVDGNLWQEFEQTDEGEVTNGGS